MAGACGTRCLFITLFLMSCIYVVAMASPWAGSGAGGAYAASWGYNYGGDMVGEVTRRVLGDTSSYISYNSLTADSVPCSTAGASYYDCSASGAANPYTRSCTQITLCARDTS